MKRFLAVLPVLLMAPHARARPHEAHGRHGNPGDLDGYAAKMLDPARDAWQLPAEVLVALAVKPGATVCDIGGGPGYFALRLAEAVGPTGSVYAVDVEPKMLAVLRDRLAASGVRNVVPVLALESDPLIPKGVCDLVLVVDTYHHFPDPVAYLQALRARLRPGGRLANIDFHAKELPVGPPLEHKVSRERFLADASAAGLKLAQEHTFLPYQYFVVLEPK